MSPNQPANPIATFAGPNGPRHPNPDDLVLFAMQLLPAPDTAAITQHLLQCTDCRAELGRIQGDLANFAATSDLHSPPASARQRFVDQVAREKKIVPIAKPLAQPARRRPSPHPRRPSPPLAAEPPSSASRTISPNAPAAPTSLPLPDGPPLRASPSLLGSNIRTAPTCATHSPPRTARSSASTPTPPPRIC